MSRKKKIYIGLGFILMLCVVAIITINWYVVKELKNQLKNSDSTAAFSYEDLSVNILTGNASASKVKFKNDNWEINAAEILLQDLSYFKYITRGKFQIGELEIKEPVITYREEAEVKVDSVETKNEDFKEDIRIKNFKITNGTMKVVQKDSVSEGLYLEFKKIELNELLANKNTQKKKVPFVYENFTMESDSINYNLNAEHFLLIKKLNIGDRKIRATGIRIVPKFSVSEFDQRISYEKDRIELSIDTVRVKDFNWDLVEDSLLFASPSINIETAHLVVYRNKLLPDDTLVKPLYSEMIRNLGIMLDLDSIRINNSSIIYREKVQKDNPPGELRFGQVQAVIKNLSNIKDSIAGEKTVFSAEALFMNKAPLTLNLEFDVQDPRDAFHVSGRMGAVKAETLNPFLKPAMNVETEGVINSMYYNFYGNTIKAKGSMKLAYEDFKVTILRKGDDKKKSFLSGLANLFIKNDAVDEKVDQDNLEVTRDQTKSFWNFLWLCIREGALKSFL